MEGPLLRLLKHGCHRPFLFLIGIRHVTLLLKSIFNFNSLDYKNSTINKQINQYVRHVRFFSITFNKQYFAITDFQTEATSYSSFIEMLVF
jgi:hypothetical protein